MDFRDHHDCTHGAWSFCIYRWTPPEKPDWFHRESSGVLTMAFQRGPYTTEVPCPQSHYGHHALDQLAQNEHVKKHCFRQQYRGNLCQLVVPSYLITNSELAALYQIFLSQRSQDATIEAFYEQVLIELLEVAYERRRAWDNQQQAPELNIAERVDGLVRVGDGIYRISGYSISPRTGCSAWDSFSEQSAPRSGTISFIRAQTLGS